MNVTDGRKRRNWTRWIWVLALIVAGGVGVAMVGDLFETRAEIDSTRLAKVERGDLVRSVVATGKIEPLAKVEVKSKASGIVKKILVDYGQSVRRGQVLVELDKEELSARVREAKAALQAAEAGKISAEAALERAKVEAEGPEIPFLRSSRERAAELFSQGLISKSVMEEAEQNYQRALNQQNASIRSLAVSRAEIARAQAAVAQAAAALERAEEELRNTTIVSPMDGLVLSRDVEIGDAVSSILVLGSQATLLLTLGDVGSVYVLGRVDEADIAKVYLGQPARIRVESFPDRTFEGEVIKISPLGEEKENVTTFEVRVSITNHDNVLRANMTANAEIVLEEKRNVLLEPETAVVYGQNRTTSMQVPDPLEKAGFRSVPVKLGISNGVKTEVLEGLRENDQILLQ